MTRRQCSEILGVPKLKKGCLQYGQRDYFLNYTRMNTTIEKIKMFISRMNDHIFLSYSTQLNCISSPEPKAHGEIIVHQSSRRLCVCVYVCVCVHTFKHEYLRDQWVNCNQILSEASLGRRKRCIMFWTRSNQNSGAHGNG